MFRRLYEVVPPFGMFGPILVVLGLDGPFSLWSHALALLGALMTGLAIASVFVRQRQIEARVDQLAADRKDENRRPTATP